MQHATETEQVSIENPPLSHPSNTCLSYTDALDLLRSHEDYRPAIEETFERLCDSVRRQNSQRKAVVLDAFTGIGTGTVVLKRLGIAMSKIIHVEHDKVATHLHKYNHDRNYNPDLPDDGGIEHVYNYRSWEDLVDNQTAEDFLNEHGRKSSHDNYILQYITHSLTLMTLCLLSPSFSSY